jgi:hypothetical protein
MNAEMAGAAGIEPSDIVKTDRVDGRVRRQRLIGQPIHARAGSRGRSRSECIPHAELDNSRVGGAGESSELGAIDVAVRGIEVGMVQDVAGFHT